VVGSLAGLTQNNVAAYVFVKPADGWGNIHPVAALTVPIAGFDGSVAISGDTIVVGDSDDGYSPGAAYVFVKPASGWTDMTPTATLAASDSTAADDFGGPVSISGNTIVVGSGGFNSYAGAAYVFVKPAGGWTDMTQTAKLTASDGQPKDFLGSALSISNNTIALGARQVGGAASGKAYVFVEPATGWADMTQTAELTVADTQEDFNMGISISVSGETVLAGAPDFYDGTRPGGAYLFVKPRSGWTNATQTAKLVAADRKPDDQFGACVLIKGRTAVVGTTYRSRGPNFAEGGAYVFIEPPGGWENMSSNTVLTGSDARHFSWFGSALDLDGNILAVGAPALQFQGAAYVFGLP
jgi:hypothetical protein